MAVDDAETMDEHRDLVAQRVVLVAEDNEVNFELVSAMLERDGFSIRWARDGDEAVAAVASSYLDLLILDLHLPRLSGLDVLHAVRADPATHDLPVLVLTADAMAGTRDAVLAEGASEYMTKPFDLNAFRAAVARIMA
jgi:CheY-like chemotaxis protein